MKHIFLIIITAFSFCAAQTTSSLLPSEQFRKFHKLTVDDGLSQNLVLFIHQDQQGFLWFGTAGGLDRFDGLEFKTYRNISGLTKQPVYFYSCFENSDSTFWISTEFGLMLFNPVNNSAKMFTPPASITYSEGALDIHHLTIVNDNTLLFGLTGKGLLLFNTTSKKYSLLYSFKSVPGGLLVEDIVGIVPREDNAAFVVTSEQVLLYDFKTQNIKSIANFPIGTEAKCVWFDEETKSTLIGTTKGIMQLKQNDITPVIFPASPEIRIESESVRAIYKDSKGTLWIGTENGVAAIHKNQTEIIFYQNNPLDPSSILPGTVLAFLEDRSENLWISVLDRGVCRIDLKKKKFYSITNHPGFPKQIASELISDIQIDHNDNLWIAGNSITYIDLLRKKVILPFPSLANTSEVNTFNTRRICSLNDSLLCFLADKKIYIYDVTTSIAKELKINGAPVRSVYNIFVRSKTGNLLCASRDSLFEIDPIRQRFKKTILKFSDQSIVPSITIVDDMIEDAEGNVWLGTTYGLLYLSAARQDRNKSLSSFKFFSDTTRSTVVLPSPTITSLAFSGEEILWIGTTAGLYKYNLRNQTMKGFQIRDGLPDDKIWSVAVDSKKRVWTTSNRGLFRLQELQDGEFSILSYTIDDGLPSNEFSMAVVASDSKGALYFGTANGVVYFHPDSVEDNPNVQPIVLTDLKIYGVSVPTEREISFTSVINIPYEKKVISMRFALLDFTNPSRNNYAYKLEGYDDRWNEAGTMREAFYTNLDPGKYTLLIKAANNDGVWNDKSFAVTIEIIPPFWMTWWFRAVVILGGLLSIFGAIRYFELRKIKRQIEVLEHQQAVERERSRIARDMHDEIGANLTRISLLSGIINSQPDEDKKNPALNQITDSVNETIDKLDEIVWAVNPSNDNLKNFAAYICEYAEKYFEASEIKCRFDLPDKTPEINLTAEKRHHLFLVVKEALNNTQKYSEAKRVIISLIVSPTFFIVSIKDDGIGFCPEEISITSNGIKNMKERINSISGEFELKSNVGDGTEISLKVFTL